MKRRMETAAATEMMMIQSCLESVASNILPANKYLNSIEETILRYVKIPPVSLFVAVFQFIVPYTYS